MEDSVTSAEKFPDGKANSGSDQTKKEERMKTEKFHFEIEDMD